MPERDEQGKFLPGNALAWRKGESGNPEGQGGAWSVTRWLSFFLDDAPLERRGRPFTTQELMDVATDPEETPAKVLAARQILLAMEDPQRWVLDKDRNAKVGGYDPEPGRAFDRVLDRVEGKSVQRVEKRVTLDRSPAEIKARILSLLESNPGLIDILRNKGIALPGNTDEE